MCGWDQNGSYVDWLGGKGAEWIQVAQDWDEWHHRVSWLVHVFYYQVTVEKKLASKKPKWHRNTWAYSHALSGT